ncbi:MAG: YihY/virulence factor BrkB family protein [Acidobacteriia bacterium]|nr:YihY/virulence factor BrkB family protein [Terriglobia bacterium]
MILRRGLPTLRYLVKTEAHTFAFSVAANVILSFFPFVVLIGWLARNVFQSPAMFKVVLQILKSQLPIAQDWLARQLEGVVVHRHGVRIVSMVMLLITSSGVFLPLEVAFNQIWGFPKNRSYLWNQIISLALAFACGVLALFSVALGAAHEFIMTFVLGGASNRITESMLGISSFAVLKILSLAASIAIFFLLYWLLPNGKVPARSVLPAAIAMGVIWDLSRYIYVSLLPWLNFQEVYGPFTISVTLMFWAFVSGLLILAGAHLAAGPEMEPDTGKALPDDAGSGISFTTVP